MDQPNNPVRWRIEDSQSTVAANRLSNAWQAMSQLELRTLLGMLLRQWKLIASILGLVMLLSLAVLSQMRYRYTAEALLSIDERGSELVGQSDPIGQGVTFNNRVDSEVEILNSSSVALGVIDRMALWRDDEFGFNRMSLIEKIKSLVGISSDKKAIIDAIRLSDLPGEQQAQLVAALQDAQRIDRRGLTSVISIKATSRDRQKAAAIANAIAASYLEVQVNAKAKTAQGAVDYLTARVDELAKNLQDVNGKTENFILDQSSAVGTPEAKAEMLRIRDEIKSLSGDQADFSTRLTRLQSFRQNPGSASPDSVPAELRALAEERAAAARKAFENTTDVNLQDQLRQLDQRISDAAALQATSIEGQLAEADKRKDNLRQQLQDIFTHQQIPNEVSVSLFRLQREADSSRKLYESFSNRLAEVRQQLGLALPNSRVVAPAIVPAQPSYPPSKWMLLAAAIAGLGLGVAAAMARENLVGGFAMPAQVEAVTGLPVIATIPKDSSENPQNTLIDDPMSSFAESLRRMRIGVEESLGRGKPNVILVTSTEPGEGKSTMALSLGRALAAVGRNVVLVDCDFRHPSVAKLSGQTSQLDLVEHLQTGKPSDDVSKKVATEANTRLSMITTSASKNQASDVIVNSRSFRNFIEKLSKSYDHIILDSPPIGYVVDSRILAEMADYMLYVVKQNSTSQQDAVGGLRQLLRTGKQSHVGLVLNAVQSGFGGYYYGSERYSYYYKGK